MASSSSRRFKTIGVFGGVYPGQNTIFADAAVKVGEKLAEANIQVVCSSHGVGLAEAVAITTCIRGGHTLIHSDSCGPKMGDTLKRIYNSADAFIVLPGGHDTLKEFACVLSWSTMASHRKPIFLLNLNAYFDGLLVFLDNAVRNGFMFSIDRTLVFSVTTVEDLFLRLQIHRCFPYPEPLQIPTHRKRKRESDSGDLDLNLSL